MKSFRIATLAAAVGLALAIAPPATAQDDLVANLVSELGVSEAQAIGGVQALLGATKGRLSPSDYASLLQGAPELGKLAEGMVEDAAGDAADDVVEEAGSMAEAVSETASGLAPGMADEVSGMEDEATAALGETTGDLAAAAGNAAGDAVGSATEAVGGLDLSSLSDLTGLTSQFEGLGLDAGMVQKFVPVVLDYFGQDSGTSGLLQKGLGLL